MYKVPERELKRTEHVFSPSEKIVCIFHMKKIEFWSLNTHKPDMTAAAAVLSA